MVLFAVPQAASAQSDVRYPGSLSDEVLGTQEEPSDVTAGTSATDEYGTFADGTNLSFVAPDAKPGTGEAAGTAATGGTGGGLAATGSSVEPIVAVSIGFLAVGASAVVSSRRRLRDLFS